MAPLLPRPPGAGLWGPEVWVVNWPISPEGEPTGSRVEAATVNLGDMACPGS